MQTPSILFNVGALQSHVAVEHYIKRTKYLIWTQNEIKNLFFSSSVAIYC
jgi:hypothetical protein